MTTAAEGKLNHSAQDSQMREMLPIPRVIDYAFKADCTLYLENETLVRREVEGKWHTIHVLNDVEWQKDAEHTLAMIVGSMHLNDSSIPVRVMRHVVYCWRKW
jgi:hypothetical protein